jgi:1-deoxyxylulose-5-phosphate synthase
MYIKRRSFLRAAFGTTAAAAIGQNWPLLGAAQRSATDVVLLGPDKVRLSRLATGLGTISGSVQRKLGLQGLADYLHYGFDQGVTYWDTADAYRTHPHVNEALKSVPREKVAIMSKARATTAEQMTADLDRFRKELGTDYIDIVLMHAVTDPNWPENLKGPMDVLAEARQKGIIRTHGLSCHSLAALQAAVKTPWAHVVLSRINPAGERMDGQPAVVVPVLRQLKDAGKGVIGMKILGEGSLRNRVDECLRYAMSLDCVDCFTIGAADRNELTDLIKRIPVAAQSPMAA